MSGEHFIPFRRSTVVSMCTDELPPSQREAFTGFATMLASMLHHRFRTHIETLKDAYHPFNAQADTRTVAVLSPPDRAAARQRLEQELTALARAANFTEIDLGELDQAFREHSLLKVRLAVDTGVLDRLMVFRRGESTRAEQVPRWFGLRRKQVRFTSYARVLVYATFKDADHLADAHADRVPFRPGSTIVKLFQNVPQADLEMVFPNVQVAMRRIDKVLIGVPAVVSGIVVIATKLVASLGLILLLVAFWLGLRHKPVTLTQTELLSAAAGVIAFGAYLLRQVTKFKNRKIVFMKALSENLYFRNLDNDAGVFHHLLDAAEEEEGIEALLAYHFLRDSPVPLLPAELDRQVEQWFAQRWAAPLDFDVADGVATLRDYGLVSLDELGRLTAVPLDEAKRRLDLAWDNLFTTTGVRDDDTALSPAP